MVATELMRPLGFTVDVAHDGIEAYKKFISGNYSLAIVDVRMDGMDGLELARRIRAHEQHSKNPPLYILCVTANAIVGERDRCIEAGMDDYLAKPYNISEFQQKLSHVFTQWAMARAA